MQRRYFGTDGIRGRVGQGSITPKFVLKLGWAAGRVLGNKPDSQVLIGKDTRISGYMFESALEAGLSAAGVNIRLLGPMPTPAVAYLTRALHADAGIVISASHNPHHDNGIKFFSAHGTKLPDHVELAIERELDSPMETVDSAKLGKADRVEDAAGRYIEFCKATIPNCMDLSGLRVVVDCAHGASYHIAPHVLRELGAKVRAIGVAPDGLNINADVGSTHPEALQAAVREYGADVGVGLDGDADRAIMVDDRGEIVDGDEMLYVIAGSRLASGGLKGAVVGTLMSNVGLELALADLDVGFERTAVGDRYILERLNEKGWVLGGEPSGHIICLDRTSTGDGMVSALQVVAEMRRSGKSLRELRHGMEKYPQELVNVRLDHPVDIDNSAAVRAAVTEVESELSGRGRVLLRPSGTEPLIRVMVEGRDRAQVEQLAEQLAAAVRDTAAADV